MKKLILTGLCVLFVAGTALGDWDESQPYKWWQRPDPGGWDVLATEPKILADDFQCTGSGPITDIHFWGSWKDDLFGQISNIHISIHDDIPVDDQNPFSKPGVMLWEWDTDGIVAPVDTLSSQGWYNPNTGEYLEDNHEAYFQYNIFIPEQDAFIQEEGTIYWLDISVAVAPVPGGIQPVWGWKTSLDYWNDDAVWSDDGVSWNELRDPISGESLDMAFVITPEPATIVLLGIGGALMTLTRKRRF